VSAALALLLGGVVLAPAQLCSPQSRPLIVTLNSSVRLQLTNKKRIKTVINPKEGLLGIRTIEQDPTTIILVGLAPGITRLVLEDVDGGREEREVNVQADVEYLNSQLRRAAPLANIVPIPNGTNSVILTGYVNRAEDIPVVQAVAQSMGFTVINNMRTSGVQQVQLDVVIALVRRSKGRNFGFNFLQNSNNQILGSSVGNLIPTVGPVGVPSSVLQPVHFGNIITSAPGSANLFGGVIGNSGGFLAFLQALESENLAKVLAQPRLVSLSGNPASFLVGGEQAVPVPAGLGQVGVQFEEFGTRLNFLPIVLGNGKIHLEVEPEVSTLDPNAGVAIAGATVAGRATQRVHTTVQLETGQTFVIGGLLQKTVTGTATKVPVLGQLPFLGTLFSTKSMTEEDTELVVMVTPHLVDAQSKDQVVKVLPGQESRTPDDFELFLEGILEAPRGPRQVFVHGKYVPAFLNGPTADLFPCAGRTDGLTGMIRSNGATHPINGDGVVNPPVGNTPADVPAPPAPPAGPGPVGKADSATPPATTPATAATPPAPLGGALPAEASSDKPPPSEEPKPVRLPVSLVPGKE
jgi:pilus assembly protein CpaC